MKKVLHKIIRQQHLSFEEAKATMIQISTTSIPTEQIVAFMVGLQVKGVKLEELHGFQSALMELSSPLDFGTNSYIDVCGTGGDGKDTFNISTTTAFVLASLGFPVVKHGNYSVSSSCGSSNVLESLGIRFCSDVNQLKRNLEKHQLVFLHAPLFHPALKKFGPLRKELGIPSFFNELGPLINPAQPAYQLSGTYRLGLARFYQHILAEQKEAFYVVHGLNGYDELTFDGSTRVLGKTEDFVLSNSPNKCAIEPDKIRGGSINQSAEILQAILSGKGNSSQNTIVAGNVALGIRCFEPTKTYEDAFHQALEHIESGKSIHLLKALQA